ncbi:uncharacterized protein LOC121404671 [Drosophila obscura]|uniref:uncharacterized protein LOC121404671 n=1 Tax=Drosophila obscura TaxID=7282 RepID=UPI001BB23A0E|nr:uncharacterized protein LOC121404671 [Drosophila obscura]
MTGPVIQPALLNILIQFRTYPVALTGDICKMYRCVKVSPPDNFLQCILWRDSIQSEVQVYTLDTVTYGTRAASFLAVREMHQLAIDEGNPYPLGSAALLSMLMISSLAAIRSQRCLMEFQKTTWRNFYGFMMEAKTLGLAWDPASDQLLFALSAMDTNSRPSKRSVLSTIARFYDPLGLINPVIVRCKIFLQQLWREHLDWDESLPTELLSTWIDLRNSLASISRISFPRVVHHSSTIVEVHGFCDASMEAYGACIYVVSRQRESSSNVLCSKSRIAPLKSLSIPKLELSGAHLLAKVMRNLKETGIFPGQFYCWSDSSTASSWIRDEPAKFQVFVANRVATIQELTQGMEWRHVPTLLNPADILSRGSLPSYLIQSELWFHGPSFLLGSKDEWPVSAVSETPTIELRKRVLLIASPHADLTSGCKFANSFFGMQRTFAYMHKFVHRLRHPGLTVSDIQQGTHLLVRHVQLASLWSDIKEIRRNGKVRKSSSISSLSPFIDPSGLLRVGGRLGNSSLPFNAQHPLILPKGHPVTSAMISYYHQRNLHAGPRALLAKIRLEYWPIGGIKAVSKAVSKCVRCFRTRPRMVEHIMGDLPKERLEGSRAFEVTGVDYCGPFFYRSEIRTRPPIKCYISVFIYFTSKAIHMELRVTKPQQTFWRRWREEYLTLLQERSKWRKPAKNLCGNDVVLVKDENLPPMRWPLARVVDVVKGKD